MPKKSEYRTVNIRLPRKEVAALEAFAEDLHMAYADAYREVFAAGMTSFAARAAREGDPAVTEARFQNFRA